MTQCQTIPTTSLVGYSSDNFQRLSELGFGHWIYSAIPNYHDCQNRQVNRVSSYPAGFIESYNQRNFATVDPSTPYWFKHTNPASFRKVRRSASLTSKQKELMSLNADFAVNKGIVLPMENVTGFKSVLALSFDGSLAELNSYIETVENELYEISESCNEKFLQQHSVLFLSNSAPKLTPKQKKVLGLLARGKLTKQIADMLSISVNAVDKHIANIKISLSARTSAEAVALALQWHLI